MSDDVSHLKAWAERVQGIAPEDGPADDVLRAVERVEGIAREAAKDLPFEAEPAAFVRLLEELAPKAGKK